VETRTVEHGGSVIEATDDGREVLVTIDDVEVRKTFPSMMHALDYAKRRITLRNRRTNAPVKRPPPDYTAERTEHTRRSEADAARRIWEEFGIIYCETQVVPEHHKEH